jgi:hypothetical protein
MVAVLAAAVAMSFACDDGGPTSPPPSSGTPLKDLTQKSHVLSNIEAAYNNRRIDWYNGVLDANFTFFLSPADVGGGLPESWNRADEIDVNTKLFDKNYTTLPCQSIFVDIRSEDGLTWQESTHTPVSGPDETWYTATVYYEFHFEIAPNSYIPLPGAQASFVVRNAGTDAAPHWQLVEMRDLGGTSRVSALQSTTSIKESSWGRVKALYH